MLFSEYNFFKFNFIEPASPLMYGIIELHDHIFFFLNMILFLVLFLLVTTLNFFTYDENSKSNRFTLSESTNFFSFTWLRVVHGTTIEIIWTVIPSVILILIAIPSFALLYATDELVDPAVTIQVVGHQWYWSYEYNINSVITPTTGFTSIANNAIYYRLSIPGVRNAANFAQLNFFFKPEYLTSFFILQPTLRAPIVPLHQLVPANSIDDLLVRPFTYLGMDHAFYVPANSIDDLLLRSFAYRGRDHVFHYPLITFLSTFNLHDVVTSPVSTTFQFDSYMRQESDLTLGELRLHETDFPLVLPKSTHIRFMITADDVIHSWSVPALGIKVDAVPGRINQAHTFIKRSGVFYGQCSELCGVNHAFTPIQILAFEPSLYYDYLRFLFLSKQ